MILTTGQLWLSEADTDMYPGTYFPETLRCRLNLSLFSFSFTSSVVFVEHVLCDNYRPGFQEWMFKGLDKGAGAGKVYLGTDTLSLNLLGLVQNLIWEPGETGPWEDGNVRKAQPPCGGIHKQSNSLAKS